MATICTEASAPGKLILFGEHAVVYGALAIAGALSDLRISVRVTVNDTGRVQISREGHDDGYSWSLDDLKASLGAVFAGCKHPSAAIKPDATIIAALDAATAPVPKTSRKAMVPILFLACAIFAERIFGAAAAAAAAAGGFGLDIIILNGTLPIAAGLGSSAAFSVAASAALLDAWCRLTTGASLHAGMPAAGSATAAAPAAATAGAAATATAGATAAAAPGAFRMPSRDALATVNAWAFSAEMLFHGSPSGLDNTVSTYGGALAYSKVPTTGETSTTHVATMPALRIMITNTHVPKETSKLVAGVRVLHNQLPTVVKPILTSINAVSERFLELVAEHAAWRSKQVAEWRESTAATVDMASATTAPLLPPLVLPEISEDVYTSVKTLARVNQSLLNALGVGHPALDGVVAITGKLGLVTKLTGAGGGGCALTLLPPKLQLVESASAADAASFDAATAAATAGGTPAAVDTSSVVAELTGMGYDCFETRLGGDGVLLKA